LGRDEVIAVGNSIYCCIFTLCSSQWFWFGKRN
jgi:hypothetical protein